jgi:hypothetical protein
MGIFDPNPGGNAALIAKLMELVKSPQVQYGGKKLIQSAPMAGQPFKAGALSNINLSGLGALFKSPPKPPSYGPEGSVGGAFGAGIASALMQGGQQQQSQDPMMQLWEQLLGQLQSPVSQPQAVDKEDLMRQVQAALNPIYDQRIDQAEGTYDRGSEDITNMYRALANDYKQVGIDSAAQNKQAQEDVAQLYGQLRSNVEGSFSRVSDEQAALFKQLGIEDALPDVLGDQQAAVTEASTAASQLQASNEQRYLDQGNIDQRYYQEGIPLATLTGNEFNEDLLSQLTNYTNQTNAERSSGIQSAYMDQLGQAQNMLMQQQQMSQGEAARRQEMLMQILMSQLNSSAQQQQQEPTPDSYMSGLNPMQQQSVAGAFTRLQRSPEAVYGKVEDKRNPVPGSFVETTPEWYLSQADEMLRRGEIDAATHQMLQQYMMLYFQMGQ